MPEISKTRQSILFKLNMIAFALHLILAIVTGTVGNINLAPPIYNTKVTFTYNSSETGFSLDPYYVSYGGYPITALTVVFFVLTAFFHLANATFLNETYISCLELCFTPTRWIEYFLTASLMSCTIAYLSGSRSVLVIVGVCGLIASTMLFGFISELYNRPRETVDAWERSTLLKRSVPHFLGYVPYLFAWFIILYSFFGSGGTCAAPAWVWVIILAQFIQFSLFVIPQLYQLKNPPSKFIRGEYYFIFLSFFAKATLGIILLAGGITLENFDAGAIDPNITCDIIDLA
ncbi:hypothetical protein EXVG_00221 [Emiliania huxleyi virus 202]|nr:hypothetical protein EXVG_00221 [Emiliania huxleyi virus 202]AHA54161.1 putative membrane protein [Emiliania huxleyi virus 18]AHA55207.1 putative membrane protein [Emiliania huxleyi virus 156]